MTSWPDRSQSTEFKLAPGPAAKYQGRSMDEISLNAVTASPMSYGPWGAYRTLTR